VTIRDLIESLIERADSGIDNHMTGRLMRAAAAALSELVEPCGSCGMGDGARECPKSQRPCSHHCNHSWTHDACHWCGCDFGESGASE